MSLANYEFYKSDSKQETFPSVLRGERLELLRGPGDLAKPHVCRRLNFDHPAPNKIEATQAVIDLLQLETNWQEEKSHQTVVAADYCGKRRLQESQETAYIPPNKIRK